MNEMHPEPEQTEVDAEGTAAGRAAPDTLSVKRILLVVIPVGLLVVAGTAFFGVFDGLEWVRSLMYPPLVRADVRVIYRGQPVANALLMTKPAGGLQGAVGMPGKEPGLYVLQTDLQGQYNDGAYAGEHKVTVAGYGVTAAAAAPPLLTPAKYSVMDTTDLVITVSRSPESNHFVLELDHDGSADADGEGVIDREEPTEAVESFSRNP